MNQAATYRFLLPLDFHYPIDSLRITSGLFIADPSPMV